MSTRPNPSQCQIGSRPKGSRDFEVLRTNSPRYDADLTSEHWGDAVGCVTRSVTARRANLPQ